MMEEMNRMGDAARRAMQKLNAAQAGVRDRLILDIAKRLRTASDEIVAANRDDMAAARKIGLSDAMLDRLMLDGDRVGAMADALETIAGLPDPLGRTLHEIERPNGLTVRRISVPLGVIAIIYESRPNVTADAAAISMKAGNSVILRGGSESVHSSKAIVRIIRQALVAFDLDADAVQIVPDQDRARVGALLTGLQGRIDVVVPRGGRSLVERVQQEARVPVIGHLEGLCHVYVDASADAEMAAAIVVNAKMRRTGICGAAETLLIDKAYGKTATLSLLEALRNAGCELRGCERTCEMHPGAIPATEADWRTEYLAPVISVRIVDGVDAAISHIANYGSGHTDSIVAGDELIAARFLNAVDSAIVMHNASTQFADGGEFGMGAEIGISTSRVHARGPVGAEQLTSYKYVVRGDGQVRPG